MNKNQEIINQKNAEVEAQVHQHDFIPGYILHTLNNFAYRYFDNAKESEMLTPEIFRVQAVEKGIKEAIKIKSDILRAGLGELVKQFSKEAGPTVVRELSVAMPKGFHDRHLGEAIILARISWGHPEHTFHPGSFIEKRSVLTYNDELQFRNTLARHLEEVAELFG